MAQSTTSSATPEEPSSSTDRKDKKSSEECVSDEDAQRALDGGDNRKIDEALDQLDVSTTASGKDQTAEPDTEGSNSSSKDLDHQDD
ncbi:hypothetical protein [Paraburkholderia aromaticivorans]|uniref:hypothetical protein n=1 Tax=Paraburkholderia aromaticivorans TaxID=2026199 RepID=UPI0014561D56|nr:hypothetical protein [Paraburkholderia aromaticivorans]